MPESIANTTTLLLCLFGLMAIGGFGMARYFGGRMRTVKQGHIAVIHWMDRFSRTAGAGPYWLRPFEEEIVQVYVRQREAIASVPKIFTDGGLAVTVDLRYSFRLEPERMATDELYYGDAERKSQQEMLMREVLLDLVQELSTPAAPPAKPQPAGSSNEPAPLNIVALFSPFAGPKEAVLRRQLKERISRALLPHGIVITSETVQIASLNLPPGLGAAYAAFLEAPFNASARAELIRRVRAAAPDMPDAALVQLLNILQNPSADIQTIFTTGTVNQDMLLESGGPVLRQRLGSLPPEQPAQPAAEPPRQATPPATPPPEQPTSPPRQPAYSPPPAPKAAPTGDENADPDYPLVERDNALLKSTRVEQLGGR